MIPKSVQRFSERSCSNKKLERDDDSRKSHPALSAEAAAACYHCLMNSFLRALTSLTVGITTVVGMVVYQHYSREPPSDAFTVAVMTAASILAWLVTGLE